MARRRSYRCESRCQRRHQNETGRFKGGFAGCVRSFEKCCTGVRDPRKLCAFIGHRAGRI